MTSPRRDVPTTLDQLLDVCTTRTTPSSSGFDGEPSSCRAWAPPSAWSPRLEIRRRDRAAGWASSTSATPGSTCSPRASSAGHRGPQPRRRLVREGRLTADEAERASPAQHPDPGARHRPRGRGRRLGTAHPPRRPLPAVQRRALQRGIRRPDRRGAPTPRRPGRGSPRSSSAWPTKAAAATTSAWSSPTSPSATTSRHRPYRNPPAQHPSPPSSPSQNRPSPSPPTNRASARSRRGRAAEPCRPSGAPRPAHRLPPIRHRPRCRPPHRPPSCGAVARRHPHSGTAAHRRRRRIAFERTDHAAAGHPGRSPASGASRVADRGGNSGAAEPLPCRIVATPSSPCSSWAQRSPWSPMCSQAWGASPRSPRTSCRSWPSSSDC
jgi:hypothetical protein